MDRIRIWRAGFVQGGKLQNLESDDGSKNRTQVTLARGERSHHYVIPANPNRENLFIEIEL